MSEILTIRKKPVGGMNARVFEQIGDVVYRAAGMPSRLWNRNPAFSSGMAHSLAVVHLAGCDSCNRKVRPEGTR